MSRIFITGCAGFIGSHVLDFYLSKNHAVIGLDNFDPYYSKEIKNKNILDSRKNKNFIFIEGDILDFEKINSLIKEFKPDLIIHLAALAGVRPSIERPELYVKTNIEGTSNILKASVQNNVKRVLIASSSSVYGDSTSAPFKVNSICSPISPYGATKLACESLAKAFSASYHLETICLRFFTVYGPRQRPDLAIHKFIDLILQDKVITIFGDGSTSRDYTFIDDIVRGIEGAANLNMSTLGIPNKTYNLGSKNPIRLDEMIKTIETVLSKKAEIKRLPEQIGDMKTTYADIAESAQDFGYQPQTTFEQGIQKFVDWYRNNKGV